MKQGRPANNLRVALLLVWILAGVTGGISQADTLAVKIRAINPSKIEKQSVTVKSFLPAPATPADVIDAAGLDIAYDIAAKTYYVHKVIELDPGQTRTFEVKVRDIWVVPESVLDEMAQHVSVLMAALKGTAQGDTAEQLNGVLTEGMKAVKERQNAYVVGVVKPIEHIRAYESNMEALTRIRRDIGMMENLVIAAGKDPGKLLGASRVLPPASNGVEGSTGNVVIVHIKVTNPSPTEKRTIPLRRDFPIEVKPTDVIDAGGLQIGFDSVKNVCYAFSDTIDLAPQESKVFDVKLINPWGGIDEWILKLEARAKELSELTKTTEAYTSVVHDIELVIKELIAVKAEKVPDVVNEEYVASVRRKTEALKGIESRLIRLEELFQPREKPQDIFGAPILNVKSPSRQTTWMIIYIILGFLAVVSLMFYLRWFGKGKAEKSSPVETTKSE
jgi:hypothetical protein